MKQLAVAMQSPYDSYPTGSTLIFNNLENRSEVVAKRLCKLEN